jgi:hypothetical protein
MKYASKTLTAALIVGASALPLQFADAWGGGGPWGGNMFGMDMGQSTGGGWGGPGYGGGPWGGPGYGGGWGGPGYGYGGYGGGYGYGYPGYGMGGYPAQGGQVQGQGQGR